MSTENKMIIIIKYAIKEKTYLPGWEELTIFKGKREETTTLI